MKKYLLAGLVLLAPLAARSEEPKLLANFGSVKLYVPLTSIDTTYQWDFVGKQSLVGGETPVGSFKRLTFTAGAVTSLEGNGTPFVGAKLDLSNPVESYVSIAGIHPGLFVGRDFNRNEWIYGLKFSANVF